MGLRFQLRPNMVVVAKKPSAIRAFFLTTTIKLRELRVLRGKKICLKLDQLFWVNSD